MDLLATPVRRRILFTAYYFVEGAPIGFLWWTIPALLHARGVGEERIGALLGWLVLPWALKWIWAPLVDLLQAPSWTLRGWIGAAQVGMLLTLAPLLFDDAFLEPDLLVTCLCAHAFFAATQDAAIDALMIRTTTPEERGKLAGWMQVGMLAGRSLLGGGALLVLPRLGERAVVSVLLLVVVAGFGLQALYRAPLPARPASTSRARDLAVHLRAALARPTTWIGLAFAALAGAGFEALGAFAGPLLTELAEGDTDVAGGFFLTHAVLGMAAGGVAGGWLTDRLGPRRGTALAGASLGAAILATSAALGLGRVEGASALVPWLTATYVTIGWFTAASYALFMSWTDERLGATQFSAFMGATNLCESWSAVAAGRLIPRLGHATTFGLLSVIGLLALPLTALAREERARPQRATPD